MRICTDHSFRWRKFKNLLIKEIRQQEVTAERRKVEELYLTHQHMSAKHGNVTIALTTKA
jgi:hypothetical protein